MIYDLAKLKLASLKKNEPTVTVSIYPSPPPPPAQSLLTHPYPPTKCVFWSGWNFLNTAKCKKCAMQ